MTFLEPNYSLVHAKGMVAKVLLEHTGNTTGRRQLAQRDIATLTGTDWETVHKSLKSLQDEGAIRIERHRIFINKDLLRQAELFAQSVE
jgi:DNA-binding MarR family transcriptional regulator